MLMPNLHNNGVVSLKNGMLDGSFDEALPIGRMIYPEVAPRGEMLYRVLEAGTIGQLSPKPM